MTVRCTTHPRRWKERDMYASEMIEALQDLVERYGDVLVETKGRASDEVEVEVESPVIDVSMNHTRGRVEIAFDEVSEM